MQIVWLHRFIKSSELKQNTGI